MTSLLHMNHQGNWGTFWEIKKTKHLRLRFICTQKKFLPHFTRWTNASPIKNLIHRHFTPGPCISKGDRHSSDTRRHLPTLSTRYAQDQHVLSTSITFIQTQWFHLKDL
jgi:hypothetical protein